MVPEAVARQGRVIRARAGALEVQAWIGVQARRWPAVWAVQAVQQGQAVRAGVLKVRAPPGVPVRRWPAAVQAVWAVQAVRVGWPGARRVWVWCGCRACRGRCVGRRCWGWAPWRRRLGCMRRRALAVLAVRCRVQQGRGQQGRQRRLGGGVEVARRGRGRKVGEQAAAGRGREAGLRWTAIASGRPCGRGSSPHRFPGAQFMVRQRARQRWIQWRCLNPEPCRAC